MKFYIKPEIELVESAIESPVLTQSGDYGFIDENGNKIFNGGEDDGDEEEHEPNSNSFSLWEE